MSRKSRWNPVDHTKVANLRQILMAAVIGLLYGSQTFAVFVLWPRACLKVPLRQGPCQERPSLITRGQHLRVHAAMVCAPVIRRCAFFRCQPSVLPSRWHPQTLKEIRPSSAICLQTGTVSPDCKKVRGKIKGKKNQK